jgi:hypothetical protein
MMEGMETLALAAKAAGLKPKRFFLVHGQWMCFVYHEDKRDGSTYPWEPLHFDGPAFRLALKLGINFYAREGRVWFEVPVPTAKNPRAVLLDSIEIVSDTYSTARLAIVQAAAEVGRTML